MDRMSAHPSRIRARTAGPGSLSSWTRAVAASAPSNTTFSVCWTLIPASFRALKTWARTPTRSRCLTVRSQLAGERSQRLTAFGMRPEDLKAETILTTSAAMAFCACSVEAPTWWVPTTPGRRPTGSSNDPVPPAGSRLEDVEAGPDPLLLDRLAEGRRVDHLPAARVHERGAGLSA